MRRIACLRVLLTTLAMGAALFVRTGPAAAQNSPEVGGKPYEYKYALPVFGDKVAKRGITFPLPWGLGLNYAFIDQPVSIDSLQLGINDGEMHDLSQVVKFDRVNSKVHGMNARLDVWLFPFWNVYGLVNYAAKAITDVRLSEPIVLNAGAEQAGGGGGLGTTLAMGFWGIFATIDFNWTMNKMQKLDAPIHTILVTPRVGTKIFRYKTFELTAWVGAMFQRIGVDTQGKIRLSDAIGEPSDEVRDKINNWYDGLSRAEQALVSRLVEQIRDTVGEDPVIKYRLDKRVAYPWNMLIGAQFEFTPNWQLRAEVGFIKRTQAIVGLNYRFGLFEKLRK